MIRTIEEISTVRDGKSRTFWFGFFFFSAVVSATALVSIALSNHRAGFEVCALVRENYFRAGEAEVKAFLERCDREAAAEPATLSRRHTIERINRRLKGLKTSHLQVHTPAQNRQIWTNEGLDTGIRARRVEGEIVIHQLIEESPGVRAGLRAGDAVVSVNGADADEEIVISTPGLFKIARGAKLFTVDVEVEEISEDLGPRLTELPNGVGYLRIGSFLPHYFADESWAEIAGKLKNHSAFVIDVRGNAGGSFPAMLRALSPFFCKDVKVGELWTTAEGIERGAPTSLPDDLRASVQLEALKSSGGFLQLKSFPMDVCTDRPVVVLADESTSSVSEIFSEALSSRANSRVWGTPTAGQVVMARWFEVGSLGGGDFAMSIPIAGYRTREGVAIESDGLLPEKIMVYDLESALAGKDDWLEEAHAFVSGKISRSVSK
ncbi:MAG: S41 family peptidase [Bdellovibrionota bacterium]